LKYFITGGAGFIGSHMVDALIDKGQVTVYDNLSSGKLEFIQEHLEKPNLQFIQGDCGDLEHLREAMAGHDLAIHYASNPDIARGFFETDLDIREGTILTYNVLEAMRTTGVGRILYTSGSGIYGDVGTTPTPEDFGPLLPISFYGASKLACEGLISAFCYQFNMQGYILRMGNVVGRRQTHGVGFDFINKLIADPGRLEILGDGTQQKSYVHVSDVINAHLFVAENTKQVVNVYNLATDDTLDVTSIAQIVIEEMRLNEVQLAYTGGDRGWKGDVPQVRLPAEKLKALGWRCGHNSMQAVRRSVREMLGKE
jgi:UDP-glucose 4-epimerase